MGKMKELFMQQQYQIEYDLEREYLTDDLLAQEESYNKFLELSREEEFRNPTLNTKIEVANVKTRATDKEEYPDNQQIEIFGS